MICGLQIRLNGSGNMKKIRITLQSDLCVGSGYGYGGIIDGDITFDQRGIPYIPAKRIKGCLRDCGEMLSKLGNLKITEENVQRIFGKWGENQVSGLHFGNAILSNYDAVEQAVDQQNLTKEEIISFYTQIKSQTAVTSEGIAQEGNLRMIRVIGEKNPFGSEALTFELELIGDLKEEEQQALEMICKSLRHMGMARTRGWGNVKCEYLETETLPIDCIEIEGDKTFEEDQIYCLSYVFKNMMPLILSEERGDETLGYISGQRILGALVGEYLKHNKADAQFDALFMENRIKIGNAYLYKEGRSYQPAPLCIGKYKKSKEYSAMLQKKPKGKKKEKYQSSDTDQLKSLKDKFVALEFFEKELGCKEEEISYHTTYHYRRPKGDQKKQLYTLDAIDANQFFKGEIWGYGKELAQIFELLDKIELTLGKSKSAEYGRCKIIKIGIEKAQEKPLVLEPQKSIVVHFVSDGIFDHPQVGETIHLERIGELLKEVLGETLTLSEKYAKVKVVTGYYGVWNLPRESKPALSQGSCLVFKNDGETDLDLSCNPYFIGERQNDGYGKFYLYPYEALEKISVLEPNKETIEPKILKGDLYEAISKNVEKSVKLRAIGERIYNPPKNNDGKNTDPIFPRSVSASLIGRVSLMLKESNYDLQGFMNRLETIKRDRQRKDLICYVESIQELYGEHWNCYIKEALIHRKYQLKQEGKNE